MAQVDTTTTVVPLFLILSRLGKLLFCPPARSSWTALRVKPSAGDSVGFGSCVQWKFTSLPLPVWFIYCFFLFPKRNVCGFEFEVA